MQAVKEDWKKEDRKRPRTNAWLFSINGLELVLLTPFGLCILGAVSNWRGP